MYLYACMYVCAIYIYTYIYNVYIYIYTYIVYVYIVCIYNIYIYVCACRVANLNFRRFLKLCLAAGLFYLL